MDPISIKEFCTQLRWRVIVTVSLRELQCGYSRLYEKVDSSSSNITFVAKVYFVALMHQRKSTDNILSGSVSYFKEEHYIWYYRRNKQRDCSLCQTVDHVAIRISKCLVARDGEMFTRLGQVGPQMNLRWRTTSVYYAKIDSIVE